MTCDARLQADIYKPNYYLSLMEFRELTLQRLKFFVSQRFFSVRDYLDNPRKFMAALESLSFIDYSLAIKSGVHFTLCGGTICKLGTAKHHEKWLPTIDNLETPGEGRRREGAAAAGKKGVGPALLLPRHMRAHVRDARGQCCLLPPVAQRPRCCAFDQHVTSSRLTPP